MPIGEVGVDVVIVMTPLSQDGIVNLSTYIKIVNSEVSSGNYNIKHTSHNIDLLY